jgi:protein phosphatase
MLDVIFGQASNQGSAHGDSRGSMGSFIPGSSEMAYSHGYLFAIADGAGCVDSREIASALAISVLLEEFEKAQSGAMLISLLPRLIQLANAAVHDRSLATEFRGMRMATTLVACALRRNQAVVAHVGDSCCFLIRNQQVKQITHDRLTNHGPKKFYSDSPRGLAESHARSMLGPEMFVSPDTIALTVEAGDVIVLCSETLRDEVSPERMAGIVSQEKGIDEIALDLLASAGEFNSGDIGCAHVIRVRSVEQICMFRRPIHRLTLNLAVGLDSVK